MTRRDRWAMFWIGARVFMLSAMTGGMALDLEPDWRGFVGACAFIPIWTGAGIAWRQEYWRKVR